MKKLNLNYTTYADFFRSLSLLIHSGTNVSDGLLILSDEESQESYAQMLRDMSKEMDEGSSLAEALEKSRSFPAYALGLIEVGEKVGRLEETLSSLARYYDERDRTSRALKTAFTYPAVLLLTMLVVIVLMLSYVLPIFDDVYASLGSSLDGFAGFLLNIGEVIRNIMPYFGILLGAIMIIAALVALVPAISEKFKKLFLILFGDRGASKKINNAHFAQALSMALSSGMPIEKGLELAEKLLADVPSALARCKACGNMVYDGKSLAEALEVCGFLSKSSCRMLTLGIRAGNADNVMKEISSRMSDEADEAIAARVAKIEPALVLITSFMVGAILISVMLPLINIMKAIG